MLDFKVHSGLIKGLTISRNAPPITSILYADDLLVCGLAEQHEVLQINANVEEFCLMSGQKIGIENSRIWFSKRTAAGMKQYCMQVFQAAQGEKDHTYLGVPIMPTRISHYDYLMDKVIAKLHIWRAKLLSPAAKITLIKAVVEPMVLYSMGAGPIPESVLQKINLKIRSFFWNTGDKNKMRLVSWDKITVPKAAGGLGLRDITLLNKAMAMKMLWRMVSKECEQSLWVKVLTAKYLSRTAIWLATVPRICTKLWAAILAAREALKPNVRWVVSDGQRCAVIGDPWHDFWLQFTQNSTPALKLKLVDLVDEQSHKWNTSLLIETLGFHGALYIACLYPDPPLNASRKDRLVFMPTKNGNFTFKGACNLLQPVGVQQPMQVQVWKAIWYSPGILPRIRVFLWKLMHEAVPVRAVFARRLRLQPPPCDLCGKEEDDVLHVLFTCDIARNFWFSSHLAIRADVLPSQIYEGVKLNVRHVLGMAASLDYFAKAADNQRCIIKGEINCEAAEIDKTSRICIMDGSFKEDGMAGWARMIYEEGDLVGYEIRSGKAASPFHVEAMALQAAVMRVQEEGWSDATFYTDSQLLARILNGSLSLESSDWRAYVLVASATATFVMMFSSSLSVVEFYFLHRFPIPYALYLISVSVLAGFWGQYFVRKLVKFLGRESIIVFILSSVIFASAVTMGITFIIFNIYILVITILFFFSSSKIQFLVFNLVQFSSIVLP
ncbi:hypothetical protein LUZ61_001344 [Rhynchospora tenuis]|uniref:Reverse transcriptase zinc-binding domain-containing protein n=2 Tax=Magnoliopsida TaxID=3398 RepID=A0AAD5ZGS4_9POAL|nr:hypothetical protein LUZ61_001344 [Rhynchospora tenuis]